MKATLRRTRSQIVTSIVPSPSAVEFRILGPPEIRLRGDDHSIIDLTQTKRLGSDKIATAIGLLADADLALRGAIAWPPDLVMEVLVARLARLGRR